MNPCKATGCDRPGEWHVLRVVQHDPIHGPVHDGRYFAPYRITHVRQAEFCIDHARADADERNRSMTP